MEFMVPLDSTELEFWYDTKNLKLSRFGAELWSFYWREWVNISKIKMEKNGFKVMETVLIASSLY